MEVINELTCDNTAEPWRKSRKKKKRKLNIFDAIFSASIT